MSVKKALKHAHILISVYEKSFDYGKYEKFKLLSRVSSAFQKESRRCVGLLHKFRISKIYLVLFNLWENNCGSFSIQNQ